MGPSWDLESDVAAKAEAGEAGVAMHELSIVASVVDAVTESLASYPGARVAEVRLRVGVLAAVVEDSLRFCWEIATDGAGTENAALKGARLVVTAVPVTVHCAACGAEGAIESLKSFLCPRCGEPATDVRSGRELEIEAIEIEEDSESASQRVGRLVSTEP